MQLFYAPAIAPPSHTLSEEESRHCIRVLRLRRGDRIHITDGRGDLFCCEIDDDDPRRCTVRVVGVRHAFGKLPYGLTVAVAPTKSPDRFEWFVEKATEVGIEAIIPLQSEHSERHTFRSERAGKVIVAAMKQSLKAYRPELHPLTPFRQAVLRPFAGRRLIAHCAEARSAAGKQHLARTLRPGEDAEVFIGPEGDFSAEEIDFALAHGFEEITLGPQRLRTETAALVAAVTTAAINASDCDAPPPATPATPDSDAPAQPADSEPDSRAGDPQPERNRRKRV